MRRSSILVGALGIGVAAGCSPPPLTDAGMDATDIAADAVTDTGLDIACEPACRAGYVCLRGTCVSACNPPCEAGQVCTSLGTCISPTSDAGDTVDGALPIDVPSDESAPTDVPSDTSATECVPAETRPCYSGPASTEGVGPCHGGIESCTAGGFWSAVCATEQTPAAVDACGNGVDDDCNGMVDETCPVSPPVVWSGPTADHTCVSYTDGTARCAGTNDQGQLGDGSVTSQSTPRPVIGLTNVYQMSLGHQHTCAVRTDGSVWCWGANDGGQLGNGTTTMMVIPTRAALPTGRSAVQVAAGYRHTCAVLSDHTVSCWGNNGDGMVDPTSGSGMYPSPTPVAGLTNVQEVYAGTYFNCALLTDRTLRCWGSNVGRALGGTGGPLVTVTGISTANLLGVGGNNGATVLAGGAIRAWGTNNQGQLGDGTMTDQPTPVPAAAAATGAIQLALGGVHSCALLPDHTARCWGSDTFGQLGDGRDFTTSAAPVVPALPSGVTSLAAGNAHTCAVAGTTVYCWGSDSGGQNGVGTLGGGGMPHRTSPTATLF